MGAVSDKLRVVRAAATRSPARQALADAIEALGRAKHRETDANGAVTRIQAMVADARVAHAAAVAGIDAAREAQARRAADAALSGAEIPTVSAPVREARSRETDAADALGTAEAALASVTDKLAETTILREQAEAGVSAAVKAVLRERVDDWLARTMEAMREVVRLRGGLHFLIRQGTTVSEYERINKVLGSSFLVGEGSPENLQDWRVAAERLIADPDAPLPSIGGR